MKTPTWTHEALRASLRLLPAACALSATLAWAGTVPADTTDGITWKQIVQKASCMLSSFADFGLKGLTLGYGACTIHIRIDP